MKRQLIVIGILLALVLISCGTCFGVMTYTNNKAQKEADAQAALQLIDVAYSDFQKIGIRLDGTDYIATLDENNAWSMDSDFDYNVYFFNSIAGTLCTLSAQENLGAATPETKQQYALNEDSVVITLETASHTYELTIGKLTATKEYYYVMTGDSEDIFLVSADTYGDYLNPEISSMRNIYVQKNRESAIVEMSLERDGSMIYDLVSPDAKAWEMDAPLKTENVNLVNVGELRDDILQWIVDKFGEDHLSKEQYAEYGFDKPKYIFQFRQEDGTVNTIYALEYNADAASALVECLCVETGQHFFCASNYMTFLQAEPFQFVSNTLYTANVEDVAGMEVDFYGDSMKIDIDEANSRYTINDTIDVTALGNEAVAALENFYTSVSGVTIQELLLEEAVSMEATPEITVSYTLNDGTTEAFAFLPRDDRTYWVLRNGEYSGFTVTRQKFTGRTAVVEFYNRLKTAVGLE